MFGGVDVSKSMDSRFWKQLANSPWSFAIIAAWGGHSNYKGAPRRNLQTAIHAFNDPSRSYPSSPKRTAAYCALNFDDEANQGADGKKAPSNQDGHWQVQQALLSLGFDVTDPMSGWNDSLRRSISFFAVDVERLSTTKKKNGTKVTIFWNIKREVVVPRIREAVDEVCRFGLKPVIYTKNSYNPTENGDEWSPVDPQWDRYLVDIPNVFADFEAPPALWLSRPAKDPGQRDDLNLDLAGGTAFDWRRFGGWQDREGKQYAVSDTGTTLFSKKYAVDLDVFRPRLFGVDEF